MGSAGLVSATPEEEKLKKLIEKTVPKEIPRRAAPTLRCDRPPGSGQGIG